MADSTVPLGNVSIDIKAERQLRHDLLDGGDPGVDLVSIDIKAERQLRHSVLLCGPFGIPDYGYQSTSKPKGN